MPINKNRKYIYVCSPCRGDFENNMDNARSYCRAAVRLGYVPVAPHVYFTQFMDDAIPDERALGMQIGLELLSMCDELWVFGKPSEGMATEISEAERLGIPVYNGFSTICG